MGESRSVTIDGRDYTIAADALDDFELLDEMVDLQTNGNALRVVSILRRLIGPDQMKTAMDALRNPETGRVSIEAGATFVGELFKGLNPN